MNVLIKYFEAGAGDNLDIVKMLVQIGTPSLIRRRDVYENTALNYCAMNPVTPVEIFRYLLGMGCYARKDRMDLNIILSQMLDSRYPEDYCPDSIWALL